MEKIKREHLWMFPSDRRRMRQLILKRYDSEPYGHQAEYIRHLLDLDEKYGGDSHTHKSTQISMQAHGKLIILIKYLSKLKKPQISQKELKQIIEDSIGDDYRTAKKYTDMLKERGLIAHPMRENGMGFATGLDESTFNIDLEKIDRRLKAEKGD